MAGVNRRVRRRQGVRLRQLVDEPVQTSDPEPARSLAPRREALGVGHPRRGHRGATDYSDLLRHYMAKFDLPQPVVERGEMDRIWHMLYDLGSGQPG